MQQEQMRFYVDMAGGREHGDTRLHSRGFDKHLTAERTTLFTKATMTHLPAETRRFRLDLAYDGRPYAGWQSQPGGGTVQDVLESCLASTCPEVRSAQSSGRTDAGVSALGQVVHFDVPSTWRMDSGAWMRALNSKLPGSIRVMRCEETQSDFHARFSALEKTYDYHIVTAEVLPPLLHRLAWHQVGIGVAEHFDPILAHYCGTHDFRAFSAKRHDGYDENRDTVRTLYEASARPSEDGSGVILRFRGTGFLYRMVRFLVGTTVYALRSRVSEEEIDSLLQGSHHEAKAPYCAPADGLTLVSVRYGTEVEPIG